MSCLLLAAASTAHLAADGARRQRAWGDTRHLVAIARPVAAGTPLTRGDLVVREVPAGVVPTEAVAAGGATAAGDGAVESLLGRVATTDLVAGELLVAPRLAPPGFDTAGGVGPDGRVVAVPLDRASPPLSPGDRVDLLASHAAGPTAQVVATRGEVMRADEATLAVLVDGPEVGAVVGALLGGTVVPVLRPD